MYPSTNFCWIYRQFLTSVCKKSATYSHTLDPFSAKNCNIILKCFLFFTCSLLSSSYKFSYYCSWRWPWQTSMIMHRDLTYRSTSVAGLSEKMQLLERWSLQVWFFYRYEFVLLLFWKISISIWYSITLKDT